MVRDQWKEAKHAHFIEASSHAKNQQSYKQAAAILAEGDGMLGRLTSRKQSFIPHLRSPDEQDKLGNHESSPAEVIRADDTGAQERADQNAGSGHDKSAQVLLVKEIAARTHSFP